jgi:hypothetical protein
LNKERLVDFIKFGKEARKDLKENIDFNYLQALIIEAIAEANLVSLIIFEDGEFYSV